MELIKNFKEMPYIGSLIPLQNEGESEDYEEEVLPADEELRRLSHFNAGQVYLAEEIHFALEQIQISISLNDGNFCNLLDELQENVQFLLDAAKGGEGNGPLS